MNCVWKGDSKLRKQSLVTVRTVEVTPVEKDLQEISTDLEGKDSSSVVFSTPCLPRTSNPCKSVVTFSHVSCVLIVPVLVPRIGRLICVRLFSVLYLIVPTETRPWSRAKTTM